MQKTGKPVEQQNGRLKTVQNRAKPGTLFRKSETDTYLELHIKNFPQNFFPLFSRLTNFRILERTGEMIMPHKK